MSGENEQPYDSDNANLPAVVSVVGEVVPHTIEIHVDAGSAAYPNKAQRLRDLDYRRRNPPKQIDNAKLYAGSPMYYYCISCGALADVKPENWFLYPPKKLCKDCQELKDLGWLE